MVEISTRGKGSAFWVQGIVHILGLLVKSLVNAGHQENLLFLFHLSLFQLVKFFHVTYYLVTLYYLYILTLSFSILDKQFTSIA